MTKEEAITLINSAKLMLINPTDNEPISDLYTALETALNAIELMGNIKDRPCEACEFKVDGNCQKWNCVFDEWLHEYVYGKRGAE